MNYLLWTLACAGAAVAYVTMTRNTSRAHLIGVIVIGMFFWIGLMLGTAFASTPFDPPPVQRAVNEISAAYDHSLRPRYGQRAGITTRCQGKTTRHMFCTVDVWRAGSKRAWFWTRVDLHRGSVRTNCGPRLTCVISVPRPGTDVLYYESRPTR